MKKILKIAAAAVVSIGAGIAVAAVAVATAPAWIGGAVACTVAAATGAVIYGGVKAYEHLTEKPQSDNVPLDVVAAKESTINIEETRETLLMRISELKKSDAALKEKVKQLQSGAKNELKEEKDILSEIEEIEKSEADLRNILQEIIDAPDKKTVLDKYKDTLVSMGLTDGKSDVVKAGGCAPGFFKPGIDSTQHNPVASAVELTC